MVLGDGVWSSSLTSHAAVEAGGTGRPCRPKPKPAPPLQRGGAACLFWGIWRSDVDACGGQNHGKRGFLFVCCVAPQVSYSQ
ncbi:hypothetical protein BaRGS_00038220, partial [Batillaria attramentaria]